MKSPIYLIILMSLLSCSDPNLSLEKNGKMVKNPFPQEIRTYCNDKLRPQFCPMAIDPVCGQPTNKTYSNECFACMDKKVNYFKKGKCK